MRCSRVWIAGLFFFWLNIMHGQVAAQIAIMPMGDSITEGFSGACSYRRALSQAIIKNACNVNFVGSRSTAGAIDGSSIPACEAQNTKHQAVSGYRADQILSNPKFDLVEELNTHKPDIVLLHIGSNDLFQNQSISSTVDDIESILDRVFAEVEDATVVVADVIPWSEVSVAPAIYPGFKNPFRDMLVDTAALGAALKTMVSRRADNGDSVVLLELRDGFDNDLMAFDGVHPNAIGEAYISNKMLSALYDLGVCGDVPIDVQSPITYISFPSEEEEQLAPSPTLTGTAHDEGGSGINRIRIAIQNSAGLWLNYAAGNFEESFDSTIVATMSDTTNKFTNWSIDTNLGGGDYRLYAIALDNNGNQVEASTGAGLPSSNQDAWTTRAFEVVDTAVIASGPQIISPDIGSVLSPSTAVVKWVGNAVPVTNWWVYAGSADSGSEQYAYTSTGLLPASATSAAITRLPNDGSTVYVTLWYKPVNDDWQSIATSYTAASGGGLSIDSPTPESTLESGSQTFTWSANGTPIDEYWIYAGASAGDYQYYNSVLGAATSATLSGLPVDGSTIYLRLWHRVSGGTWQYIDTTYAAVDDVSILPVLDIPGGTAISSTQLLNWSASGTNVDQWWLYAGNTPRGNEYFDSGNLGGTTTASLSGLPSGSASFVTLWYRANGLITLPAVGTLHAFTGNSRCCVLHAGQIFRICPHYQRSPIRPIGLQQSY